MAHSEDTTSAVEARRSRELNGVMIRHLRGLAVDVGAGSILVNMDAHLEEVDLESLLEEARVILATTSDEVVERLEQMGAPKDRILRLPSMKLTRSSQVKVALMLALSRSLISRDERVVCLSGSPSRRTNDTLTVMDVQHELEIFSSAVDITSQMESPYVFDRLLALVLELAQEGKEGKPVGTTFVLGDHEKVLEMSHQLVINPFASVPEAERNVMDPGLKEVIREFATIDGAFVVRDDGVVLAAGRHLNVSAETADLPQGLGARHRSAAGITALTSAIAFVISESTGDVRIFSRGRLFMEIERGARWH